MDALHERATRIGLAAIERYGFALAGCYAIQAHGFLNRVSEDVDLFTVNQAREQFAEAVVTATDAYRNAGFKVDVPLSNDGFPRLLITAPGGSVPSWPEAEEASTAGQGLAERLGFPFHFTNPEIPDDEAPSWWDSR